jgi:hypothetical protein
MYFRDGIKNVMLHLNWVASVKNHVFDFESFICVGTWKYSRQKMRLIITAYSRVSSLYYCKIIKPARSTKAKQFLRVSGPHDRVSR